MISEYRTSALGHSSPVIINADDWGRDQENTDKIRDCVKARTISSVSAMVFMEDSARASDIAREGGIDTGIHLNLTTPFSGGCCPSGLMEHQRKVATYLRRHRLAQAVYNPLLSSSFEYVVSAQITEYQRLYGAAPRRIDGHHHMHLCANVLGGKLLTRGAIVRRNFSFWSGEKNLGNRLYRRVVDGVLARRYRVTDFFFSLAPLEPFERLRQIFRLACSHVVEIETHPVNLEEYRFLTSERLAQTFPDAIVAPRFDVPLCALPASG
jgi:chitin disaccharide deacetylase